MKNITEYLNIPKSIVSKEFEEGYSIEEIQSLCPKFWKNISQFCIDKNIDKVGAKFLIDNWTLSNADAFEYKYKEYPISNKDLREFEEKYLTNDAVEELDKLK